MGLGGIAVPLHKSNRWGTFIAYSTHSDGLKLQQIFRCNNHFQSQSSHSCLPYKSIRPANITHSTSTYTATLSYTGVSISLIGVDGAVLGAEPAENKLEPLEVIGDKEFALEDDRDNAHISS